MLFILGLPPDSRCKFFNPDPPVKKKDHNSSSGVDPSHISRWQFLLRHEPGFTCQTTRPEVIFL